MTEQNKDTLPLIAIDERADAERRFLLRPEDNDLFLRNGKQLVAACRSQVSYELWVREAQAMLKEVREWASKMSEHVIACYAANTNSGPAFYFVRKSDGFDFDLADKLVDLNSSLVKNFNVGMVSVHQISASDIKRSVHPGLSVRIYGEEPTDAHRPVEA